jgi:hypothetical protein
MKQLYATLEQISELYENKNDNLIDKLTTLFDKKSIRHWQGFPFLIHGETFAEFVDFIKLNGVTIL